MGNRPTPGMMHVASEDPSVSGLHHDGVDYAPLSPTTPHLFEVPAELGQHLVQFPHWRVPVATDYETEDQSSLRLLQEAAGRPGAVTGRRSGHRPTLSPEELDVIKADVRAELLSELAAAGLVLTRTEPEKATPQAEGGPDEEDEEDEEEPTPAPTRPPTRKATPPRRR